MNPEGDERAAGWIRPGPTALVALVLSLLTCLLWLWSILGPWRLVSGLRDARRHLTRAEQGVARSDLKKARLEAVSATGAVERARRGFGFGGPLLEAARLNPRLGDALGELDHVLGAAEHSALAAAGTTEIARSALRGKDRVVVPDPEDPKNSQIRIERLEELADSVATVRREVRAALEELEAIRPGRLPARFRDEVNQGIDKARDSEGLLADAEDGLRLLPEIFGAEGPRTYLFGMQNNAEQRGTGGALLQFTTLSFEDGRPTLGLENDEASTTVYDIDRNRQQLDIPLPRDAWYVRGIEDAQRFGNANWSPDWPLSARLTVAYGKEAAKRFPGVAFPDIDGAVAVDPIVMQHLLPGAGHYRTPSRNRISERKVVFFLLYKAYAAFPKQHKRRKVLRQVVDGFYERLVRPRHPAKLTAGLGRALDTKHMQIWMRDAEEQRFVERMNWDGGIEDAKGSDYLYIVEQNVGGNKLDYYSEQTTTADIRIEGDDSLVRTEARVRNGVFLPQPLFPMGNTGSLREGNVHRPMLNLYVPRRAKLLEPPKARPERLDTPAPARWSRNGPAVHYERGKKVWSGTLQIPPQEEGTLSFHYRSPGVVRTREGRQVYRLQVQRQPKVRPELLILRLRLPPGARAIRAPGWARRGGVLLWRYPLEKDILLEVSWRR